MYVYNKEAHPSQEYTTLSNLAKMERDVVLSEIHQYGEDTDLNRILSIQTINNFTRLSLMNTLDLFYY